MPSYAFIGGVEVSRACLEAACSVGSSPTIVIGYDESRAGATGYADLEPLCGEVGSPLLRVRNVNASSVVDALSRAEPDLIYVIGWSQLVNDEILSIPRFGCVGIHPTPLPVGRGRAPIPWTILKGCRQTASTMFFLTRGTDDGDIIGQVPIEIDEREDAGTLYAKHRAAHIELVQAHHHSLLVGTAQRHAQDEGEATYWPARSPEDGVIRPTATVCEADRLVRAVTRPFPGAFVPLGQRRLTIWRAEPAAMASGLGAPGNVAEVDGERFLSCQDGALRILEASVT